VLTGLGRVLTTLLRSPARRLRSLSALRRRWGPGQATGALTRSARRRSGLRTERGCAAHPDSLPVPSAGARIPWKRVLPSTPDEALGAGRGPRERAALHWLVPPLTRAAPRSARAGAGGGRCLRVARREPRSRVVPGRMAGRAGSEGRLTPGVRQGSQRPSRQGAARETRLPGGPHAIELARCGTRGRVVDGPHRVQAVNTTCDGGARPRPLCSNRVSRASCRKSATAAF
jgi:hypothetical protein